MSRSRSPFMAIGALAAVVVLSVAGCGGSTGTSRQAPASSAAPSTTLDPSGFAGYVKSPTPDVSSVTLPAVGGGEFQTVGAENGFLIVYFGYTQCPDVCPLTLGFLKQAIADQSVAGRKRVRVAMITVDPERDTPKVFGDYLKGYFPTGVALRTDDIVRLREAADRFGADFSIRIDDKGKREVTHSAELYVVDHTGKVVLAWAYGLSPRLISSDLTKLLDGKRPVADG